MKRILLLAAVLALLPLAAGHAGYAIVNNSTSSQTAHDSLSIPFFLLDSAGSQVAIASGDSVFLTVWYPGGALAFADSGAYNDADITALTQSGTGWYSWQAQVSDLDGTPTEGTYSYIFGVHDQTGADLWTPFSGTFQLYATADLDVALDEIAAALDTLQNQDNWGAHQSTSDTLHDSLLIILDSLEALEAWIAHQTTVDSLYDSLLIVLDSLEALEAWIAHQTTVDTLVDSVDSHDGWIAHQTTSDSLYDSLLIVLDSLEALEAWIAHQTTVDTIVDSVNSYDGWVAHQTTSDTLHDSLLIILDSLEALEAWVAHQTTSDSLYDSLLIVLDSLEALEAWVALQAELDGLVMYFGACDECYQILYPRGGAANKDSVVVIDPSLGADSLVGKIVFYHGTVPAVYDSTYFYIDFPW